MDVGDMGGQNNAGRCQVGLRGAGGMCGKCKFVLGSLVAGMEYDDEVTWNTLIPVLAQLRERAELEGFKNVGVYEYISCEEAVRFPPGEVVGVNRAATTRALANNQVYS